MAGFSVGSLSTYTVEGRSDIKRKIVFGAVSIPLVTVYEGIKYSEKIPYMTSDPVFQALSGCSAQNSSGDGGTFADITLTVDTFGIENEWCFDTLRNKFTQKYLRAGANMDENAATAEFMNTVMEDKDARVTKKFEIAMWQSSKTQGGSNTDYKQFNGLLQSLETVGGYVNSQTVAGTSHTSITTSNVITIFNNVWLATPSDLRRQTDTVTVCGEDTFDKLVIALTNANMFHYKYDGSTPRYELQMPGTGQRIVGVPGLNADNNSALPAMFKNRILTFNKAQAYLGTDLVSDINDSMVWYEKKDKKLYSTETYRFTTGWMFPDQVVSFATA